jgi:hypothetical protein
MNNLSGGLWTKKYNEVYGVLDKYRNNKDDKYIKNVCTNPQLELTCLEGKFLKYILKANLKLGEKKIKFVDNNNLDCKKLKEYIIKLKEVFSDTIKTIEEKKSTAPTTSSVQTGGGFFSFLFTLIYSIIVAALGIALLVFLLPVAGVGSAVYLYSKEKGNTLMTLPFSVGKALLKESRDTWSEFSDAESESRSRSRHRRGGGNKETFGDSINKMNTKQLEYLINILNFTNNIINNISLAIDNKTNININNICINKDTKNKHKKCNSKDYDNKKDNPNKISMKHIKNIFKNIDLQLDKMTNIENIENVDNLATQIDIAAQKAITPNAQAQPDEFDKP